MDFLRFFDDLLNLMFLHLLIYVYRTVSLLYSIFKKAHFSNFYYVISVVLRFYNLIYRIKSNLK